MNRGPTVIAYDGSPEADDAVRDAAALLKTERALVVVVAKEDLGFDALPSEDETDNAPAAALDIRTAEEIGRALAERAQRLAERGAAIAREAGLNADGLAVADPLEVPVAETLVDVARQRQAPAVVVGAHRHGGILGPITREVVRRAPCPIFVRGPAESAPPA